MRRLAAALLSFTVVPAAVLAGPVMGPAEPAPHAVPASLQEISLPPVTAAAPTAEAVRGTVVDTPARTTAPFEALGVTWQPDPAVGEVAVTARTRTGGRWTDWAALDQERAVSADAGPVDERRAGTEPSWVGASDGVQVRVRVLSGRAPRDLRLTLIDPGSSAADGATTSPLGGDVAHAATRTPPIRTRAQWGADESIRTGKPSYASTLQAVTLHHSASSNSYSAADVPGIIRSFYAYHVKSRGWSDIGYNVLVDRFGTAWEGRAGGLSRPVIGAHAGGFNTGTAGVSMIGTYESVQPSTAMLETVAQVAAWKLSLHGRDAQGTVTMTSAGSTRYSSGTKVTLPRIFAHRDVSATSCPGTKGIAALPGIRDRAAALIAAAPPTAPPDPFGDLDTVRPEGDGAHVSGWAIDPDASDFTRVDLSVDGRVALTVVADRPRPDLADAYPEYSQNHGFDAVLALEPGTWEVCGLARNQNDGTDVPLGCRAVEIATATVRQPTPTDSASPSPSAAASTSPSASPSATAGASPSASASPSVSPSPSASPSAKASATPAPTSSPSSSPRATATPKPSASASASPSPATASPSPAPTATTARLSGGDRYSTAAAIVRDTYPNGPVPVVFVATGAAFADALAGGPAADALGGPVLPVTRDAVPAPVRAELTRLRPARIVVLGGSGAVSDETVEALRSFTTGAVTRVAGADRYDTAAQIAAEAFPSTVPHVLVANGEGFADALAGGAAGAQAGSPVLLVTTDRVPAATVAALQRLKPGTISVLGGTGVVSEAVVAELRTLASGGVTRLSGPSRFATAAATVQAFWPSTTPVVYLATGRDFPDALAGVPAAGRRSAPMLLVEPGCMPAATKAQLDRLRPSSVIVLGGTATVSEDAATGRKTC